MARLPSVLRPLQEGGYRWLAVSLCLSLMGGGVWLIAVVWQVVAMDGGPTALAVVTTGTAIGMIATTLLGGALADRIPQRRIIVVIEIVRAAAVGLGAVLALTDSLPWWVLATVAVISGCMDGLYYPAYSALLPALLPAHRLLAANGLEGMLRPALAQAAGPALASALVAASSPGLAMLASAVASALAAWAVLRVPATPVRRDLSADGDTRPARAMARDVAVGFRYMLRTPWLLGTLLFACLMVLAMMGPFEVLTPFAIRDQVGGGPAEHALLLAAFGVAGAVASLITGSVRMPRRYLSVMNLSWGIGSIPLIVFGIATDLWPMVVAAAILGAMFSVGSVIWGTLLQRRVPPELLGRVSSLDFFVSLAFMPLSMALAGTVGEAIGVSTVFFIAGIAPLVICVAAMVIFRMPADEIAHPLDVKEAADGSVTDRSPAVVTQRSESF
ncbi:MFS transporter [Nakamurella leprariae]|uniref:MFS transporter n=1 Tax=Nakamurella leprariae TaxID=2803911 RepID=A0A938YBE8_9ACTN|nr:MFS transporter [Nakamurella leprariae]MBM9466506.1 MFS transporter [Nakamurella leprariae]